MSVPRVPATSPLPTLDAATVEKVLVTFLREELRAANVDKAVLGLSGGIDSAVVAFLAAEALGADHVTGVLMPAETSNPDSLTDARAVAEASDVVVTIVGFPSDLRQVILGGDGVLAGTKSGNIIVDMTTSEPSLAVEIAELARRIKPLILLGGYSAYPRTIDFARMSEIAKSVKAYLLADIAHIAGLVVADLHPSPVGLADVITSTTHKTLRGPRGGIILSDETYGAALGRALFPGIQGGPLMHIIAAKAVSFSEALKPDFRHYQRQVIKNAKVLAEDLSEYGFDLVSGGTDNHLILIDLTEKGMTGFEAERVLGKAGIFVNKNTIPFDKRSPRETSGLRMGTPALTTRGMKQKEMKTIAELIRRVLEKPNNEKNLQNVRSLVLQLCDQFPIYGYLQEKNK